MNKYIYTSGFYLDVDKEEINISKSKEEYKQDAFGGYRLDKPYFVSCNYSTYVLDGYMDRELEITDRLQCFYSFDESKIDEWISKKKYELISKKDKYIKICEKLKEITKDE